MDSKTHPLGFVIGDGKITGPLKVGFSVNGVLHKDFELREAMVDDLLDAENEADITKPLNFNAQLLVRQLVRVGSYTGPFTVGMIRRLKPADWRILRAAQSEVDALGEGDPASAPAS